MIKEAWFRLCIRKLAEEAEILHARGETIPLEEAVES